MLFLLIFVTLVGALQYENVMFAGLPRGNMVMLYEHIHVWEPVGEIHPENSIGMARFGFSMDMATGGKRLAIGGPRDNAYIGAVWIFEGEGKNWTHRQKLVGRGIHPSDNFGYRMEFDLGGENITIWSRKGKEWLFSLTNGIWEEIEI
jgi:hypothetical protein